PHSSERPGAVVGSKRMILLRSFAGTHVAPVKAHGRDQSAGDGWSRGSPARTASGRMRSRRRGRVVGPGAALRAGCPCRGGAFGADTTQDLGELARTGRLAISVERTDDVYRLDASAVLRVDARRLLGASVDYERYVQFGVPNLRASHVVSGATSEDV